MVDQLFIANITLKQPSLLLLYFPRERGFSLSCINYVELCLFDRLNHDYLHGALLVDDDGNFYEAFFVS